MARKVSFMNYWSNGQSPMAKVWAGIRQTAMTNGSTTSSTGPNWLMNTPTTTVTPTASVTTSHLKTLWFDDHDHAITPTEYEDRRNVRHQLTWPKYDIADGRAINIRMPDGGFLEVSKDGSYVLNDKDSKVIYRANRIHDFNPFLNASDKIEEFIRFCGSVGVKQDEMMDVPIRLFIAWLVIEAAKADGEPEPADVPLLPDLKARAKPRCRSCGRFTSRKLQLRKLEFCRPVCFESALVKI